MNHSDMFYADGTLKIERFLLRKEGFPDIHLRRIYNKWEMLAHKYRNGDTRWLKLNMPEELIQMNIEMYGVS